jgi:hypothetical protein
MSQRGAAGIFAHTGNAPTGAEPIPPRRGIIPTHRKMNPTRAEKSAPRPLGSPFRARRRSARAAGSAADRGRTTIGGIGTRGCIGGRTGVGRILPAPRGRVYSATTVGDLEGRALPVPKIAVLVPNSVSECSVSRQLCCPSSETEFRRQARSQTEFGIEGETL